MATSENHRELRIGAGSKRNWRLGPSGRREWNDLATLDINADPNPHVGGNLENLPLPFGASEFDGIHAYEVLQHTGQQGDHVFFLAQFSEFWRILKPDDLLVATCPSRNLPCAWGDPWYKRIVSLESISLLVQREYVKQVGVTPMTDLRYIDKTDFDFDFQEDKNIAFAFAPRAIEPSRVVESNRVTVM